MKRFVVKLLIFAALLIVIDFGAGWVFKLFDYTKGGEIGKVHAIMSRETPELLVLGSSRAAHHFVPRILSDSLQMTTYNAGMDGQGTTIAYGFLKGIEQRTTPKMIICEVTPNIDLYEGMEPTLSNFYPYVKVDGIEDIIVSSDELERFKLKSNLYRLNSSLFRLLPSIVLDRKITENGYLPSFGKIDVDGLDYDGEQVAPSTNISPEKEKWLHALIEEADKKGIDIYFTISPMYGGDNEKFYTKEIDIIQSYGKPVFNHLNDKRFINSPAYFHDVTHLNDEGALKFTRIIIEDIKQMR